MRPACLLAIVVLAAIVPGFARAQGAKAQAAPIEERVAFAAEFRAAVEAHDTYRLLRLVWTGGLQCGDGGVSRDALAEELRNRSGAYYARLFDTRRLREVVKQGSGVVTDAVSFEEFFRLAPRRAVPQIEGDAASGVMRWKTRGEGEVGPIPAIEYLREESGHLVIVWLSEC